MKKKIFALLVCVGVLIVCLTGCGTSIKTDVVNNMADIRYNIFSGQSKGVVVNLMCGMRENPYIIDGFAKKPVQFGVITATLSQKPTQPVHYTLTVSKQTFSGVLEENPYNHTFMVDIEKIVSVTDAVYITIESVVENLLLVPESEGWAVQYDQALDIGIAALEEKLKTVYEKRKFKAECFLKIVLDQSTTDCPYYWCFGFNAQNGSKSMVIFDVKTGEILTEKSTNS